MKSFFPMRGAEARILALLVAFSVMAFLPTWRMVEIAGMAAFGWLMAILMVMSPALALWVFLRKP